MYAQQWLCLLPARGRPSLSLPSGGGRPSGNRTSWRAIAASSRSCILDRPYLRLIRNETPVKNLLVTIIVQWAPAVVAREMSAQRRAPRKLSVLRGVGWWNGCIGIRWDGGRGRPGLSRQAQLKWPWPHRIPLRRKGRRSLW